MRVLHVLDHSLPLQSGYSFRTHSILKNQRELGVQTEQITLAKHSLHDDSNSDFSHDGVSYSRTAPLGARARRLPVLNQTEVIRLGKRAIQRASNEFVPDIIHAHSPCLNGIAAIKAGSKSGIPIVYEMRASWEDAAVDHGSTTEGSVKYRMSRELESWVLRNVDEVVTICDGLRREIETRGISGDRITVVPNAVDIDEIATDQAPIKFPDEWQLKGRPILGFIGSFYAYEGLETLLRAFALLKNEGSRAALLLVGGGPQEKFLKRLVKELSLDDTVHFVGRVRHEEVPAYYQSLDAAVYPRARIRLTETVTPLKPLEAMAAGIPVLASDVGGHRELIDSGQTGQLFPPGDPAALAATIERLISSPDIARSWVSNARGFVENERTWSAVVSRYLPVYGRLTQRDATMPVSKSGGP